VKHDQLISNLIGKLNSRDNDETHAAVDALRELGCLSDGTLRGGNFLGANLQGLQLAGADLHSARLEWSQLDNADLTEANLQEANLSVTSLKHARLVGVDLRHAQLLKARLQGADLRSALLNSAELGEARLHGANLRSANLSKARLGQAELVGADLSNATLKQTWLRGADLEDTSMEKADMRQAYLGEANLRQAILRSANLAGAILTGATLLKADLRHANLTGARLTSADLRGADLSDACLRECNLSDANLQNADLTGVDLRGANLTGTDLFAASLDQAYFDESTILPDGRAWSPAVGEPFAMLTPLPDIPTEETPNVSITPLLKPSHVEPAGGGNGHPVAPVAEIPRAIVRKKKRPKDISAAGSTRRQIRGSSLLLVGRMISMVVNFVVQVLTVRYLTKANYGAFAYALSIVSLGETIVTLGLDRAVTRFVPIYQERDEYPKMFGTLVMVFGTILSLGIALVLAVVLLQDFIATHLISDQKAVELLVILVALSPVQAIDNVLNGSFAVFSKPSAIFFRKYVLGPALKITVVALLILGNSGVEFLAAGYLGAGLVGISIFSVILWRMLRAQDFWAQFSLKTIQFPAREVLAFTVPLLASDMVFVVMNTVDAILLERYKGTVDVAAFRAVQPTARLNQMVLSSFALLFTPAAARMFARNDKEGINSLYWQNAVWVAIVSFPVFALTFSLAEPLTVLLYGSRYEQSALIMAMLSLGYYFNAATGQNGLTLKVLGKLRYIVGVDILAAVINLLVNLTLIPRYGAMGAAIGTMTTLILFNILKQIGLMLGTGIRVFDLNYLRVYLSIVVGAVGLLAIQAFFVLPLAVGFAITALVSLLVLRLNRRMLNLEVMFPELLRIPIVRWFFGE